MKKRRLPCGCTIKVALAGSCPKANQGVPTCTNTGRHQHQVRPGEGRPRGATTREPDGTEPFAARPLPITRGRPLKLRQTPTTRRPPSRSSLPGRSNAFCIFSRPSSRRCRPPAVSSLFFLLLLLTPRVATPTPTVASPSTPARAWPPPATAQSFRTARAGRSCLTYQTASHTGPCRPAPCATSLHHFVHLNARHRV